MKNNQIYNKNKGLINPKENISIELSSKTISDLKEISINKSISLDDIISLALLNKLESISKGLINPNNNDKREITITKAGTLYGVSRWTMRRYILKGKLKPSRVSRLGNKTKNFYYLADIETLFSAERQ